MQTQCEYGENGGELFKEDKQQLIEQIDKLEQELRQLNKNKNIFATVQEVVTRMSSRNSDDSRGVYIDYARYNALQQCLDRNRNIYWNNYIGPEDTPRVLEYPAMSGKCIGCNMYVA